MKLAIAGGKGGTGKSTLAANLAEILSKDLEVLLIDADVDNPSIERLMKLDIKELEEVNIFKPEIVEDDCTKCGECVARCPEHALIMPPGNIPLLMEDRCNGCKACFYACRYRAISEGKKTIGLIKVGLRGRIKVLIGELKPGIPFSPVMVHKLIEKSLTLGKVDIRVYDCPPGAGNAVVQLLKISDYIILVTEPTPFGLHNFKLMAELVKELGVKAFLVINRADIPGGALVKLKEYANKVGVKVIAELPYDERALRAYIRGEPVVTSDPDSPLAKGILNLSNFIREVLEGVPYGGN